MFSNSIPSFAIGRVSRQFENIACLKISFWHPQKRFQTNSKTASGDDYSKDKLSRGNLVWLRYFQIADNHQNLEGSFGGDELLS